MMINPEYFDFLPIAKSAGITDEQVEAMLRQTMEDYHGDRMMAELRVLRTCNAVAKGACTIAEALDPDQDQQPNFRIAEDENSYRTGDDGH